MSLIPAGVIDHIGIVVHDLDAAAARYQQLMGAELISREAIDAQGVEVAFLQLPGSARVELMAPRGEDGSAALFLERSGEGLHHICMLVDNIEKALAHLRADGVSLVDEEPRAGAEGAQIAFLHPEALGGVLLELKEKPPAC